MQRKGFDFTSKKERKKKKIKNLFYNEFSKYINNKSIVIRNSISKIFNPCFIRTYGLFVQYYYYSILQ